MALFNIIQGVTSTIMQTAGFGSTEDTVLPVRNHRSGRRLWIFCKYSSMGGNADRWTLYYSVELHYDYECIWKIFSLVSLYCHSHRFPLSSFARRAEPEYRKKFLEILCSSVSGGSNRGACLHYFFIICIITASSQS